MLYQDTLYHKVLIFNPNEPHIGIYFFVENDIYICMET